VQCRIATGSFTGITLADAWREMPAEWRGTTFAQPGDFPLLANLFFRPTNFPSGYPDDAYAAEHEKAAGGVARRRCGTSLRQNRIHLFCWG